MTTNERLALRAVVHAAAQLLTASAPDIPVARVRLFLYLQRLSRLMDDGSSPVPEGEDQPTSDR